MTAAARAAGAKPILPGSGPCPRDEQCVPVQQLGFAVVPVLLTWAQLQAWLGVGYTYGPGGCLFLGICFSNVMLQEEETPSLGSS